MHKIEIDTDKVTKDLVPLVASKLNSISNANSISSSIQFPDDDFEYSKLSAHIGDCYDKTDKYFKWLKAINSQYIFAFSNESDKLSAITFDEIETSLVVK